MSCNNCGSNSHLTDKCYEARLSLGLKSGNRYLIGSIDGQYIKPVDLKPAVEQLETNTALKYDPNRRGLVFENERNRKGQGAADFISTREVLAGSSLGELGGVETLIEKGLANVAIIDGQLQLQFTVPTPVEFGELTSGFIAFVGNPNDGKSHYRLITPSVSGSTDTVLIGHPDGSVEFANPINSPITIETTSLTSSGAFSGTPGVSSGNWRYQEMGTSQVITNTSGSKVEVVLELRWSMQTTGSRSGFYATLVNGGSDYKTTFVSGLTNEKQEGYPGGQGRWVVTLEPNQRCQLKFGAWTNATGNMTVTLGSVSENAGNTVQSVQKPTIYIKRLV